LKNLNETSQTVDIGSIQPHPDNPRRGDVDSIAESIEANGFYGYVVVQKSSGNIIAGSHRWVAANKVGMTEIPAVFLDVDDDHAKRILLADNRNNELGGYDNDILADLLQSLVVEQDWTGLVGTGFTSEDLQDILEYKEHPFVTERVNLSQLKPHPQNYQVHPDDQLEHIMKSIKAHGYYRNVVIARDGTILAGHGIVQATTKMGKSRVPVIRLDLDPNEPRALKVLISDNEINNLAEVDDRLLTGLLRDIMQSDDNSLLGTGFNEEQAAALTMISRHASEIANKDEAAEWLGMPDYEFTSITDKIIVSFDDPHARYDFADKLGIDVTDKTKSIWWPPKDKEDPGSIMIEG
jgi:ParB-like chromosome segregation protein Spo0J